MRRFLIPVLIVTLMAAGCREAPAPEPAPPPPPAQPGPQPDATPPPAVGEPPVACAAPEETAVYAGAPGTAPEPGPSGTSQRPGIRSASVGLTETGESGGAWLGDKTLTGRSGVAVVGIDRWVLHVQLDPAPDAQWWADSVHISGAAPKPLRDELVTHGLLELAFPRGSAGDTVTVRVSNLTTAGGSDELQLTFCRFPEPAATLEVRVDGAWQPVSPEESYAGTPLGLRLQFSQPMDRATVEQAIQGMGQFMRALPPEPPQVQWESDSTLTLTYVDPPPVMLYPFSLAGARSQLGLWTVGNLPVLHTGPAPFLAAVPPGRPAAQLAEVPAEVNEAAAAPDGHHLFLRALRWYTGFAPVEEAAYLINTATGQRRALPAGRGVWKWAGPDHLLLLGGPENGWQRFTAAGEPAGAGALPAFFRAAPSPAGNRLALLIQTPGQPAETSDHRYAYDLQVVDMNGTVLVNIPEFVHIYRPPTEWHTRADLAWAPDGTRIAALSDGPDGVTALVTADLATGTAATVNPRVDGIVWGSTVALAWAPDGTRLAAGPALVDAATGQVTARLAESPHVAAMWSPDSQWLAWHDQPWGDAWAYHVPTGRTESLGQGFVAGWDAAGGALVIRWAGAEYRFVPEMP